MNDISMYIIIPLSLGTYRLDELLVGAPLYSVDTVGAETGRVYVYRNVGVSLVSSP